MPSSGMYPVSRKKKEKRRANVISMAKKKD
jgi:hypothetical protein